MEYEQIQQREGDGNNHEKDDEGTAQDPLMTGIHSGLAWGETMS